MADAHNRFTLALYDQLRQRPGNLFFSPFSVRMALSMALEGARGETAAEMRAVLRVPSSDVPPAPGMGELWRRLTRGREYDFMAANALWGQTGAPLKPEFLERIAQQLAGEVRLVDFRHDADGARRQVNDWVEDATRQRIRDLVPPGGINELTRLVLTNAVYFKGAWDESFPREATQDEPFWLDGGGSVRVPLMHQSAAVWYGRGDGYQAVDLNYRGGDLAMLVLLPDRPDGLAALEQTLSAPKLHACVEAMHCIEVKLYLPRFSLTWAENFATLVVALGMTRAVSRSEADFSGINGLPPSHPDALFLSAVLHKAFVEVNEEGTEAAAATAMDVEGAAPLPLPPPPIPVVRADHPFLFAIRDRKTGTLLFWGRIVDPTQRS